MIFMADAAFPTFTLPRKDTKVVCGYIGGRAEHVWTSSDWNRFRGVKRLPIWVNTGESGTIQGLACLRALYELHIPVGSRVVIDMETEVNSLIIRSFYSVLHYFGYEVWVYGSASTVFGNPACDGYWVADWTGKPHMYTGPMVRATQYVDGNLWDQSVLKEWVYRFSRAVWWIG